MDKQRSSAGIFALFSILTAALYFHHIPVQPQAH